MSSQSTLGEFDAEPAESAETSVPDHHDPAVAGDEAAQEAAGWVPTPDDVADDKCQNCGGHVTPDFVRVFGDGNQAHRCIGCANRPLLRRGGAADPTIEARVQR